MVTELREIANRIRAIAYSVNDDISRLALCKASLDIERQAVAAGRAERTLDEIIADALEDEMRRLVPPPRNERLHVIEGGRG